MIRTTAAADLPVAAEPALGEAPAAEAERGVLGPVTPEGLPPRSPRSPASAGADSLVITPGPDSRSPVPSPGPFPAFARRGPAEAEIPAYFPVRRRVRGPRTPRDLPAQRAAVHRAFHETLFPPPATPPGSPPASPERERPEVRGASPQRPGPPGP